MWFFEDQRRIQKKVAKRKVAAAAKVMARAENAELEWESVMESMVV